MPNVNNYEYIGKNSGGGGFILGTTKIRWATLTDKKIEHYLNLDNDLWSRYFQKKKSSSNTSTLD